MSHFSAQPAGLAKIRSRTLLDEVMTGDGSPLIVVVEVNLPRAMLGVDLARGDGLLRSIHLHCVEPEPEPQATSQRFDDARHEIESITGKPPASVLEFSGSLVVEANGAQIQEIAGLPSVAAIWANDVS